MSQFESLINIITILISDDRRMHSDTILVFNQITLLEVSTLIVRTGLLPAMFLFCLSPLS